MTLGHTSARLMLCAAVLISAGCLSRRGPSNLAESKQPVLPTHSKVQLLAAARQYEKEGKTDFAVRYYRQVLALDPQNVEARQGLQYVQTGKIRTQTGYDEIVATGQPNKGPRLRTRANLAKQKAELDELTVQLIAEAAASAKHVKPAPAISAPGTQPTLIASKSPAADPPAAETWETASFEAGLARAADAQMAEDKLVDLEDEADNLEMVTNIKELFASFGNEPAPPAAPDAEVLTAADTDAEFVADTVSESGSDSTTEIEIASAEVSGDGGSLDWAHASEAVEEPEPPSLLGLCTDANAAILREVAKLESDDPEMRKDGLHSLAQLGPDAASASDCVSMLLDDETEMVRAYAAWAIFEISGDAAPVVPTLTELLDSTDADVVQYCAYTLSWMGDQAQPAAPALRTLLSGDDKLVRVHAAEALIQILPAAERTDAVETLIMLTAESGVQVRTLALVTLGYLPEQATPEVTTALTSALHDSDAEVRAAAALSLGAFRDVPESTIAQLRFVADSDQEDVRQAAATALDCILR